MNTSQNGIKLISNFEGCRLTAYKPVPTEKYWTIGYGHYGADVKQGMTITKQKAEELLKQDLKKFENYVNATKLKLNQNQFDALVSFTYNCGQGNLKSLIKNRSVQQIGEALIKYNKAGGKELAGLTKRRKAEQALFFKGTTLKEEKELPYEVVTTTDLNVRVGAGTNYAILRVAKKGEKLKIWAEIDAGNMKWGKNANEFYCLNYCKKV